MFGALAGAIDELEVPVDEAALRAVLSCTIG
jgi:hypothetical protein